MTACFFLSSFWGLQPVGVVGAITPWNFPLAMITRKVYLVHFSRFCLFLLNNVLGASEYELFQILCFFLH